MAAADQEPHTRAVRPRSYQDESYLSGFLGTVGDLQKAGILQDVVLEVEDRQFPCHRLVLSAASPYFRAMFTSDMAESRQKTVVLQCLDADMFGEILSYIYSGTLHVSLDKVQPLYQAADLLQLDYVRDTCSSYMYLNMEHSTCVDLYKFADAFSVYMARKRCMQYIHRHFAKVASSEEFCSLSVNQLTEIISHDELDVKEETTVWEAVVRWVQHSREDRTHHLPSILPHIRFNLLTSDDTAAILEHPLVRGDSGSSEVVRNVVQKGNSNIKRRLGMVTSEMAMLYNLERDRLLFMNPREGKYISCSFGPDNIPNAISTTVTSDNNIYILSREPEDHNQLCLFQYNHAENLWEHAGMSSVSRLDPLRRDDMCVDEQLVEVDQVLFYLSLETGADISSLLRMRKYNKHTDQWQECSQLQLHNTLFHIVTVTPSYGPHLYFLSGTEMHCYDPSQDRWYSSSSPMTTAKICSAVAMGTEIFCTDVRFTKTMVFDLMSDSWHWQKLQGWPNPRNLTVGIGSVPRLFVLGNQLYIHVEVTEYDTNTEEQLWDSLLYMYDRSADAWRDLKAPFPDKEYTALAHTPRCYIGRGPMVPVAHIYIPHLKGAQEHITEVSTS
ncbi:kelch repeat and BTB domain-containing protein 8-like [Branchiostoma lanceolatum]|uniref:kelch repeat and BTB domain-containing protein 8-like n=1 Tax=Branchiostoma lanceolatum TaxID=7740 RepID=UPI003456B138